MTAVANAAGAPPPGRFVTVDGRRLHVIRKGSGSPLVVFEGGQGASALTWRLVQDRVAEFTQTLAWDRSGVGWSDLSPSPLDLDGVVADLDRILAAESLPAPYVLVGHSLGGFYVRRFAQVHGAEVVGMVLVDPSHERMTEMVARPLQAISSAGMSLSARMPGAMALITRPVLRKLLRKLVPDAGRSEIDALVRRHTGVGQIREQMREVQTALRQSPELASASLGDMPLVVIAAGTMPGTRGMRRHRDGQLEEVSSLSTRGRRVTAEGSDHWVPINQPEAVVDAVRDVVEAVRATT